MVSTRLRPFGLRPATAGKLNGACCCVALGRHIGLLICLLVASALRPIQDSQRDSRLVLLEPLKPPPELLRCELA